MIVTPSYRDPSDEWDEQVERRAQRAQDRREAAWEPQQPKPWEENDVQRTTNNEP